MIFKNFNLLDSVKQALLSTGLVSHDSLDTDDMRELYERRPSFLSYLPIRQYLPASETFLHEDGVSQAAIFEVHAVDADGRSDDYLQSVRSSILNALHLLPNRDKNNYIVQVYSKDEPYADVEKWIREYIERDEVGGLRAVGTKLTEQYIEQLVKHLTQISGRGGVFEDGGAVWKGRERKIRCVIYRRALPSEAGKRTSKIATEINEVSTAVVDMLANAGIKTTRLDGEGYYKWLFPWFNPAPESESGDPYELLKQRPYPVEDEKNGELPISFDLSGFCFSQEPKAIDPQSGVIELAGGVSEYLSLAPISHKPRTGVWGVDEKKADGTSMACLLDCLPEGSTFCLTITAINQYDVDNRGEAVLKQTGGKLDSANEASNQATRQVDQYRYMKGSDARVFKINMGVYLEGSSRKELTKRRKKTIQVLTMHKLPAIEAAHDKVKQNSFLTQLPMAYDPSYDAIEERSGHAYTHHIASLMPFYGKSRGTGNPGFLFFNGSGETFAIDPLNKHDRKRAAHGLLLGPTGAGKSALTCYLLEHLMAFYRPQVFVVESGNSFGPLAQHFKAHDVNVRHVQLSASSNVGLSPFSDAMKALSQFEAQDDLEVALEESINESDDFMDHIEESNESNDSGDEKETRDILGEMELAARLMITGGEDKEEARMTRPDRLLIRNAILDAARNVRDNTQRNEVIVSDVVDAFKRVVETGEVQQHKERAQYMADSLTLYTQGVEAKFFNKAGEAWPDDADVTIVDLDLFARKGNEDKLAVVMTGLLNRINGIAEAKQHTGRPIVVWIDEAHIATTNPLLAPYIATIGKMWRKLNTWLWLATQNMKDFPDVANKMLSMSEFWICLSPPKDEVRKMSAFRELSEEEEYMMLQTRKELPKFVEGVVLSSAVTAKFKNIPPTRSLALAMTEGHEKAERGKIMAETGCTEVEAAYAVGERIFNIREQFRNAQKLDYDDLLEDE